MDLAGRRYAIVGGGISGLAAAWYLQRRGAETHLIERSGELAGRAGSARLGKRVLTLGGKNVGRRYSRFRAFAESNGARRYEHFGINSSRAVDGRLLRFDSEHRGRALWPLRRVPPGDVARLGRLALMLHRDPEARYLTAAGCGRLAGRYDGRSVAEAFGPRLCELLLRSLTVRVSAAEPEEVPMANVLPYLAMLLDRYEQLADGMHELVAAAATRSRVHLATEADGLLVERGRVQGLRLATPEGARATDGLDGVVLATPADAGARILDGSAPKLASLLRGVRYFPVAVALAEYERPVFAAETRAVVFGAERALSNAGAYGTGDLNVVRYTFSGRGARSLLEAEPEPEALAAIGERALAPFASVSGNPRRALAARRMSPGLCAYHPDQARFLPAVAAEVAALPGLALAGDYLRGCSLEACFAAAEGAVATIGGAPDGG
jgi:protoporphyrinogen/coproporphyrinogen III oxidase